MKQIVACLFLVQILTLSGMAAASSAQAPAASPSVSSPTAPVAGGEPPVGGGQGILPAGPPGAPDVPAGVVTLETAIAAKGATLLSVPLDLGPWHIGKALETAGLQAAGNHAWDAKAQQFVPLQTVRPGEGYLVSRGQANIVLQGNKITTDIVEVPLLKGWSLIGAPYEASIPLEALQVVCGNQKHSYAKALETKLVGSVKGLVDGQTIPVTLEAKGMLEPWRGYWFYSWDQCKLLIPSPAAVAAEAAKKAEEGKKGKKGKAQPAVKPAAGKAKPAEKLPVQAR